MRGFTFVLIGVFAFGNAINLSAQQTDLVKVAAALGTANLKSVRFTGVGASFSLGQSATPGAAWPRITVNKYEAAINYETASMRTAFEREQGAIPPRGGGDAFTGEQRVIEFLDGNYSWDVPLAPQPGYYGQNLGLGGIPPRFNEQPPVPRLEATSERIQRIWLTPPGFLRAAIANKAAIRTVPGGIEASFTIDHKYKFIGTINRKNQIERIRTWLGNSVLGDIPIEVLYSEYETFDGGISFPTRIVEKRGGHPTLDLWIYSVEPNAAVQTDVPEVVRNAEIPWPHVEVRRIAEGVYYLLGASHHSVAIEMKDHVVVVEAPLNDERSVAVIAKIREIIPNKPIRFVVNTHHHFDYSGGLRAYVNEGATIVTHELNRPYYEKAWAAPRTLRPDRLEQSPKEWFFETFTSKYTLSDESRVVELHLIKGSPHVDGFAMVYLPKEKMLIQADAYTLTAEGPARGTAAQPSSINPNAWNLFENIQRLHLDIRQIVPLYGDQIIAIEDLARAAGRRGL